MKKVLIAAAIATAFAGVNAQAASTGTITFNGLLNSNTCEVNIDGQGASPTIGLPPVSISDLANSGNTAGQTSFNMALTSCTGTLNTVSAFFDNGLTVSTNGRLINQASGGATNVTLQIVDNNNTAGTGERIINVGNADQSAASLIFPSIQSGSANLLYGVRYYAENTTTAGAVTSSVVYHLQYR